MKYSSGRAVLRIGSFSFTCHPRSVAVCFLLLALAAIVGTALIGTGSLAIGPIDILHALFGLGDNMRAERIILGVRLPRALTALLVGLSLGMAGAIFQSISRNVLGSPDILGFTAGAATGAIVQIILYNAGPSETAVAAVLVGCATAALVYGLAMNRHGTGGYRLVLVGIGIGAVLSGVNTILLVMGDLDQAMSAQLWLGGSLNTRTWSHVVPATIGLVTILPFVLIHARHVDVIEMGDETAGQLGISVERIRFLMVMAGVGLTAIATASAGPIAFIALAAPQLARRLTGASQVPLVSGALMGAVILLAADLLAQNLPFNINLPIGMMTGLVGGSYLLYLLGRRWG